MGRLSEDYGFAVHADDCFRIGGKRYRVGAGGERALDILATMLERAPERDDVAWLLPLRGQVREIDRIEPRPVLTMVVERAEDARLRCLAIWLRGRCGGTLGTQAVARHARAPDRRLRKEAARCLKRLSAWAELRKIAETDPDPRIRRIATPTPPRPYATRLAEFSRHVAPRPARAGRHPVFVAADVDLTRAHRPKPRWLIRTLLEHIHRLVRGWSR